MKKNGKIIYVGKAKNWKNRVSSYFNREHESEKKLENGKKYRRCGIYIFNSEIDALFLKIIL